MAIRRQRWSGAVRNAARALEFSIRKGFMKSDLQMALSWNVVPIGVAPDRRSAETVFMGIRADVEEFSPLFTTYSHRPQLHCRSGAEVIFGGFERQEKLPRKREIFFGKPAFCD